jgi:eukaryotic-like serine/threonine-protein kinase
MMKGVKICPVCSREYANDRSHCSDDGVGLVALNTGAASRPEELIGNTVDGRYKIERVIGKGGMGTVYSCRHVVVGKTFAMKVLRSGVERSEGVLQRFIREAQTANAIRSRHIVEMSDFGQLPNGCFYVVMELLEGEDLTRAMKSGRLTRGELTHVFVQIAEALGLAHAQGIVHRDLKPDNVFLVDEANDRLFVKLLDFGIAKVLHQDASTLTETGVILGTPYYMSPEQARADPVDHRTDIYALGVMMYRAFTGRLPFIADSAMGVLTRHLTEAPELPSKINDVDLPLERVILRCLEKKPGDRFQSMSEVVTALRSREVGAGARGDRPGRLADDATVEDPRSGFTQSGGAFGSAHLARTPAEPSPAMVGGEMFTSRGFVTSSTGAVSPIRPAARTSVFVAVGAATMIVVGAALAFGLFGRARPGTAGAGDSSVPVVTSERAPIPTAVSASAPSGLSAEAPATASTASAPTPSASAVAIPAPPPVSPRPPHVPAKRVEPPPAATPPPAKRPSEIRSPFD